MPEKMDLTSISFDDLNDRMLRKLFDINPHSATAFGMHEPYDNHLPHGGKKRLEETLDLLEKWYAQAKDISKKETLSDDQRISLEVLRVAVDTQRFSLEDLPLWRMYPDGLEMPGSLILTMMSREYGTSESRFKAISSRIGELPRYLEEFRERFDGNKPVKLWTEMSINTCKGFPDFLKFLVEQAEGRVTQGTRERLRRNVGKSIPELEKHLIWLQSLLGGAVEDFQVGKDTFAKLLRVRGMEYTAEEMLKIAHRYLTEMKKERAEIAKRMSAQGTLERAYEIIWADSPSDFEGVLSETERQIDAARAFIKKHDLVTLEEGVVLHVLETPDFLRQAIPFAVLDMPAPFERVQTGLYIETRPSKPEDLAPMWNRAMIVNTAVHEAYPGHFHQGVMSNKKPWMHQLLQFLMSFDTIVTAYETQEGWAHYCEKMTYDQGFERTDAAAIIMLDAGIWRAVRVIYDIKLAYGEATIDEMVDLLSKEAMIPEAVARADVQGFSRTPGYPVSYLIGRHMVFELRKELQRRLGNKFDLKKFHDQLAMNGNLPFFLAREAVSKGMGVNGDPIRKLL